MRVLQFRLRRGDKIVGYEKLSVYQVCGWVYSKDGIEWSQTPIPHTDKDQFTGLCDTKGVEGYHKDICRIPKDHAWALFCQKKSVNAVIEWDRGCFYLMCLLNGVERYCSIENLKYSEIIGNVFQNKDLLEEKS